MRDREAGFCLWRVHRLADQQDDLMEPLALAFSVCLAIDADAIRCRTTPQTRAVIARAAPRRVMHRWKGRVPSSIRIRLWGINAPERCEPGYREGRRAMFKLVRRKKITCRPPPGRRRFAWSYSRPVALCRLADGTDIARVMLRQRHVMACRQFSGTYYDRNARSCVFKRC